MRLLKTSIVFLVSIFILFVWGSHSTAGTVDNAELTPATATITTGSHVYITFMATNDKTYTLKTFHAEFTYTSGLDVNLSSSPSAAIAKVDTRKRLITLEWTNIPPTVTMSGYLLITINTPAGTYSISPSNIYYVDNNKNTHTGSCNSAQIIVQQDTVSPVPPTNVRSDQAGGYINVYWDLVSASDLYGYNVYRRTPGTSYSKLASLTASYGGYTDTTTQSGQAYYYAVTAVDRSGNESALSAETGETNYDLKIKSYNAGISAAVGDINGDGKPDLVLGGIYYSEGSGKNAVSGQKVEIYFGGNTTGIPDVTLKGETSNDKFGNSLAVVDLNNDGYDDIVVGAPYYTPPEGYWGDLEIGKIYIYAGGPQVNTTPVYTRVGDWSYGDNWNAIYWVGGHFGYSVARAGDVNGDGYQDVVIGAPWGGLDRGGRILIMYGSPRLSSLGEHSSWFRPAWQYMGTSVASAGDVNNDGHDDIIAGGPGDNSSNLYGQAYLLSGGYSQMAAFSTGKSKDGFGTVVSSAGDINADGYPDIAVADGNGAMRIYYGGPSFRNEPDSILYQSTNFLAPIGDINNDGHDDFAVDGPAVYFSNTVGDLVPDIVRSGLSLIAVGDVNGDGVKDLITRDVSSGIVSVLSIASYLNLPDIILQSPQDHMETKNQSLTVQGSVKGNVTRFMVKGQVISLQPDGTFNVEVSLVRGENILEILGETPDGKISKRKVTVTYNPLVVTITSPLDNAVVNTASIIVMGTVNDPTASVTVNGTPAVRTSETTFTAPVSGLIEGPNTITATARDAYGDITSQSITVMLLTKGTIVGRVVNSANTLPLSDVSVTITDPQGTHPALTDTTGSYTVSNVTRGNFLATFTKAGYTEQDISGSLAGGETKTLDVQLSPASPLTITITSPQDGAVFNASPITVSGSVTNDASVTVNSAPAVVIGGTFSTTAVLTEGLNAIIAAATDTYGQTASKTITVSLITKGTITGTVTDAITGEGIPSAKVTVTDSLSIVQTVYTDANGNYTLSNVTQGPYSLSITLTDYSTYTFSGSMTAGQTATVNGSISLQAPTVGSIAVSNITPDSATIAWTTDQPADSLVEYGQSAAYGSPATDPTLTTSHSIILNSLTGSKTYHFRISSKNSHGLSSSSGDETFLTLSPPFTAATLGDYGNVTVMEVTGNYDAKNTDGSINDFPRQEIAKEFIRTHQDQFDFLVIFSNFDFSMPETEAKAFYLEVKNDIQGIGKQVFDNSVAFGSNGKLQGTIDMGNISKIASNPADVKFEDTLATLAHEQMHRWGANVRFKDSSGNVSSALLGKDNCHWSFLLDSDASVLYGNEWQDNGNGTFTSLGKEKYYSALDLYLMGLYDKSHVPSMLLIDNSGIDPTRLPEVGTTISGTARYVTIDDIIEAEGERVPNASASQKNFKTAFILITAPGTFTGNELAGIENIRNGWAGRFSTLTGGKGTIMDIAPSITISISSPSDGDTITGPDVTVKGAVINTTGNETGVTVNGMPAILSGNQFIASHVPLMEGSNTIIVAATDIAGTTATTSITVNAVAGYYIRLTSNIESGISPLEVTLRIDGSFSIDNSNMNVTGPAAIELIDNPTPDEYQIKMTAEGTYYFTAEVTGPDGNTYQDTIAIPVMNKAQLDNLLKAKWEGMKTALVNGDIEGAVSYFAERSKDSFQQRFTLLALHLPQIVADMGAVTMVNIKNNVAEYDLRTDRNGSTYSFQLLFVQDTDGIWKIRSF